MNEQTFIDYINEKVKEKDDEVISVEWVLWMLGTMKNAKGLPINPEWLRAEYTMGPDADPMPAMFIDYVDS